MTRNLLLWVIGFAEALAYQPVLAKAKVILDAYNGKHPYDRINGFRFRQHPMVIAGVKAAVPESAADVLQLALERKRVVDAPILQLSADRLYARSFDPVSGGEVNWAILITLDGRRAAVCFSNDAIYGKGRSRWYFRGKESFSSPGPCPGEKQDIEATLGRWPVDAVSR